MIDMLICILSSSHFVIAQSKAWSLEPGAWSLEPKDTDREFALLKQNNYKEDPIIVNPLEKMRPHPATHPHLIRSPHLSCKRDQIKL